MKIEKLFLKSISKMLTGFLAMLGFITLKSCGMYLPPPTDYTIKGAVYNKTTGTPINGIRVGYSPEVWEKELFVKELTASFLNKCQDSYALT